MNDQQLAEALASAIQTEQTQTEGFKSSPFSGRLLDVFVKLRSLNISWIKIFSLITTILDKLNNADSTVTWEQILQQIIDLFKVPPAPVVNLP